MNKELEQVLREYMDLSDRKTLKMAVAVSEAGSSQFLVALTSRLYDMIQQKVDKVDYSLVSASRGDISKIPNYSGLKECLDIIRKIVLEYKQPTTSVDIITTAIENLENRKKMFKKAFAINSPLPMLVYNDLAMAVIQSTSFLIAASIEYIKNPTDDTFTQALDVTGYNRAKDNLLFSTLKMFNEACVNKQFDAAMEEAMSKTVAKESVDMLFTPDTTNIPQVTPPAAPAPVDVPKTTDVPVATVAKVDVVAVNPADSMFQSPDDIANDTEKTIDDGEESKAQLQERGILAGLSYVTNKAVMGILNILVPIVRSATYSFYFRKQKMSDYYALQADLLQMNAEQLKNNENLSDSEKKAVYHRQMKKVLKYRQRANDLMIDTLNATKQADKLSNEEATKFKADDIDYDADSDTTSAGYSLF